MKVTLMYPYRDAQGKDFQDISHFAARRARSMKGHDELWSEVVGASEEKQGKFINAILKEEWSLDVAEMNVLVYDVEGVPSWLMTEFLRHRLIARDWSFEQRSKRAMYGEFIPVINPFDQDGEYNLWYAFEELSWQSQALMIEAHKQGVAAEKARYACLEGAETAFVVAGNVRALHHLFTLRGSKDIGGDGKAAPEFWAVADEMFRLAKERLPLLFPEVLRS